ncbi:MAG TPA: DUF1259 domain-containing protein [Pyrinomonadaceae bacterium]|nr:DUF1259 domain-containing protein [Pyrinomonadaceae bacterium]
MRFIKNSSDLARRSSNLSVFVFTILAATHLACSSHAQQQPFDWTSVGTTVGKPGTVQPDGVYKIGLPRTDLRVKVGDVEVKPTLALGSWVAFRKMAAETMVMGDLVLTEDEVALVMGKLQDGGIEITALHNHVLNESPRVMYMHISGHGDAVKLAESIHAALALSKTPLTTSSAPSQTEQVDLDTKQLDQILGRTGKINGGVYQFAIPRAERIFEGEEGRGAEAIPSSVGLATAINFQPTGGGRAAITGDFVLTASEANPVIAALRANGIAVTALHSHMLNDSPRLFFMHFWANDDAMKLARGLRAALDRTNSAK